MGLKAETEGFILAVQDQSLFTRNYQANILRNGASDKCRFCDNYTETVDHLVSGCPVLAPKEYKNRHNRVGQNVHLKICKSYKMETCEHWYEHKPQPVVEGDNVTLLWDFPIRTDRTIQANRPDIIVKDFKEKTCLLIDMSIPTDQNISAKEFDKISKYKDRNRNRNTKNVEAKNEYCPSNCWSPRHDKKKGCQKHLDTIPGEPQLKEIQKIIVKSTAHILRKALSI